MGAALFPLLDLHAFASLWYWVLMLVLWGQATDRVLGVPWPMIAEARRAAATKDTTTASEAAAAVRAQLRPVLWRVSRTTRRGLLLQSAIAGFALSLLAILGFAYGLEVAQAILLLLAPLGHVTFLGHRLAHRILADDLTGDALLAALARLHGTTTGVAILAIAGSAIWGAARVLTLPTFGG